MLHTIINILGSNYFLWLRGVKDEETGEYQDWHQAWESGQLVEMSWYITADEHQDADRVAFTGGELSLLPNGEQGSAFGYIWCSKLGMQPRGNFKFGLVGMRYGWEKARDTVFMNPQSTEFQWRRRVSEKIWNFMNFKERQMTLPAPMQHQKVLAVTEKPELFKKKITKLSFKELLQRYLRKPTTKVCETILAKFESLGFEEQTTIVQSLKKAQTFYQEMDLGHMLELSAILQDMRQLGEDEAKKAYASEQATLPNGL